MLAMTLALTLTANMARADDWDDAVVAYRNGDYATAFNLFKPLAEQGNAKAQHNLGIMYENGYGVMEDDNEAVTWYRKSARQGIAVSQYNLGLMYNLGIGIDINNKKALMWYNLAHDHNNSYAEYSINKLVLRMTPANISQAQDMAERCLASNYQDC